MSRKLSDLTPSFRSKAVELIALCVEAGIMVMIIDTLRTKEEQEKFVKGGTSWTKNSKHLAGPDGKARAIDLCPYDIYNESGPDRLQWDASHPVWKKIGVIGESVGLTWGGRWPKKDMGHFEMKD